MEITNTRNVNKYAGLVALWKNDAGTGGNGLCIADLEKTSSANVGVTRSFVILGC